MKVEEPITSDRVKTSLPKRPSGRKKAVIALLLVLFLVILFFVFLFPFGFWVADPRGQQPGPGP